MSPADALPAMTTTPSTDDSLLWVADLLASLDLPEMDLVEDQPEDDQPEDEATGDMAEGDLADDDIAGAATGLMDLSAAETSEASETLNLPEFEYDAAEDGSLFDALFEWIGDLLTSLFGGSGDESVAGAEDDTAADEPGLALIPADVSQDIVLNAVEPDQAYLDQLEEDLDELEELGLLF